MKLWIFFQDNNLYSKPFGYPIGYPEKHVSAMKQATGEAKYLDDIPHAEGELVAVFVTSTKAKAKIIKIDDSDAKKIDGVHDFISAADIPGKLFFYIYLL